MWLIRLRASPYLFHVEITDIHHIFTFCTHNPLDSSSFRMQVNPKLPFLSFHQCFLQLFSPECVRLLILVQKLLRRCTRRRIECHVWRVFVSLFRLWDFKFPRFKPNMNYKTMVFGSTNRMNGAAVVTVHKKILIH